MYASGQGRWLSPDLRQGQAVNPQSFNRYSYVLGNPANRIDPRGLCGCYPGYDEFDYLLDFGFVPDYGNYGCGGYPLLPPIGIVVFGGGGGCDYTGGSSDYLNPYQQYDYNCLVYPAGCGYYNGMPVPNYPAYGGGGYTPTPPPPPPPPRPPLSTGVCGAIGVGGFYGAVGGLATGTIATVIAVPAAALSIIALFCL
jgi:hypothetical protein